jgi:hypothetical protein
MLKYYRVANAYNNLTGTYHAEGLWLIHLENH